MTTKRAASTILIGLVLAALVATPALAKKKSLQGIPLEWKPTTEFGELESINLTGLFDIKIQVVPFTEGREQTDLIGENREDEDEGKILPVSTRDDVPAWCTDRTAYILSQLGFKTVKEGGDVILRGEVRRFFVVETGTYKSDIGLMISAETPSGEPLWQGMTGGSATRFGSSYKDENYYEVLSDGLIEAVHSMAQTEAFRDGLRK